MRLAPLSDLLDLLMPRRCAGCGALLAQGERDVCVGCLSALPRVLDVRPGNVAEARVFGRVPFVHGVSFCRYGHGSPVARLLQTAKYGGRPRVADTLARTFVHELAGSGWPYDVDVIVPVPIHWLRRLGRGYNQSFYIARSLGRAWGLPVDTRSLVKSRYTHPQVGRTGEQRRTNVDGSFALRRPGRLAGRHVLVVDDVLTTGATLTACADALTAGGVARISFLTLALTD